MTHWLDPQPIQVPAALRDAVGGLPLVAETLARRSILTPEAARAFLDPASYTPARASDLPGMDQAAGRIRRAVEDRERIAIWGDFDADGQTATALLLETLRALGADVTYHLPTRTQGHGLHKPGLDRLVRGGVQLILTCDTGVGAHSAVAHANRLGAEVIITDHHVPGEDLPPAVAVINPHRLPAGHPMRPLAGVGVAYQLARTLDATTASRALDLVALGTVADVSILTGDNRYLVQRGLTALRHTHRLGLQAIYETADLRLEGLTEEHVGFVLAPRLNALGRIEDADPAHGVELLTTGDATRARILASEMEGLNARRQWVTKQVTDAALAQIERDPSLLREHHALVLSHASWPGGVVGVVAGRLRELYGKPVALIAAPEGKLARGSARSVEGLDLHAALTDCAQLLEEFGGHAGAAGFSIRPERIGEFRAALSRAVTAQAETIPEPTISIDAYVHIPDLTLDLVAEVGRLAPFGRGNPPLTLAIRDLKILSKATIGRREEHLRVTVEDAADRTQTVFLWHGADRPLPRARFDLALTVRASDFRGEAEVQVEWLDAREREPEVAAVEKPVPAILVRDYRAERNPEELLRQLLAQGTASTIQVWAEGETPPGLEVRSRRQLEPGPRLAVWTLPPGPREFQAALACVRPSEVLLFAQDPGLDEASAFLKRLAGLTKFALQARGGQFDLEAAAAVTAQRPLAVQAGLEWLAARGQVTVAELGDESWQLAPGTGQADAQETHEARARLDALLAESAAYRAYARIAPPASLLRPRG